MKYKKGSIVPRYLIRCRSRKTQHLCKFGADVEVNGRVIKMLSDGSAIRIDKPYVGGRHGKPRILNVMHINEVSIIGNGIGSASVTFR